MVASPAGHLRPLAHLLQWPRLQRHRRGDALLLRRKDGAIEVGTPFGRPISFFARARWRSDLCDKRQGTHDRVRSEPARVPRAGLERPRRILLRHSRDLKWANVPAHRLKSVLHRRKLRRLWCFEAVQNDVLPLLLFGSIPSILHHSTAMQLILPLAAA